MHKSTDIEDVAAFEEAVQRQKLTRALSAERPYTYWTIELYDQKNGIRGGGGLGILAADTRRVAEEMGVPFVLITPFYPYEVHQVVENGQFVDKHVPVDYRRFGFEYVDTVNVNCCENLCRLSVVRKKFGSTQIVAITEPNFGELYSGMSGSDHRLYQEVSLGFGGYAALKLLGIKPAIMQLNEVATFFAALARLDELASSGMDFYEAVVYTRKHTLYTNHTLVQAAEAQFSYEQFERFVFPNLHSRAVKKWLSDKFDNGWLKLSSVTIEIAELRSGVSKLHARVANYNDIAGNKVKFHAVTNGVDLGTWVLPEIREFYQTNQILDKYGAPAPDYLQNLNKLTAPRMRALKTAGRQVMNNILREYPEFHGRILQFKDSDFVFVFKRRFVDYKRPDLPFRDVAQLRAVLEPVGAYYIITGRVHTGDATMAGRLKWVLDQVASDDYLRDHVFYIADYDERLAYGLSVGSNAAVNIPIVGLEACGTSWMKDIANLGLLISTHDGGVADGPTSAYLNVSGGDENEELAHLYERMSEAIKINQNGEMLARTLQKELTAYLPVISGARMMRDYLDYLFKL